MLLKLEEIYIFITTIMTIIACYVDGNDATMSMQECNDGHHPAHWTKKSRPLILDGYKVI
jgi:hypothetical protein